MGECLGGNFLGGCLEYTRSKKLLKHIFWVGVCSGWVFRGCDFFFTFFFTFFFRFVFIPPPALCKKKSWWEKKKKKNARLRSEKLLCSRFCFCFRRVLDRPALQPFKPEICSSVFLLFWRSCKWYFVLAFLFSYEPFS